MFYIDSIIYIEVLQVKSFINAVSLLFCIINFDFLVKKKQ